MSYKGVVFESETQYVQTATGLIDRLKKVEKIIDALYDAMVDAAAGIKIDSYSLDDGQAKINTKYRNPNQIEAAISGFEKRRNSILRQLQGSSMHLMHGGNFKGNRY